MLFFVFFPFHLILHFVRVFLKPFLGISEEAWQAISWLLFWVAEVGSFYRHLQLRKAGSEG